MREGSPGCLAVSGQPRLYRETVFAQGGGECRLGWSAPRRPVMTLWLPSPDSWKPGIVTLCHPYMVGRGERNSESMLAAFQVQGQPELHETVFPQKKGEKGRRRKKKGKEGERKRKKMKEKGEGKDGKKTGGKMPGWDREEKGPGARGLGIGWAVWA